MKKLFFIIGVGFLSFYLIANALSLPSFADTFVVSNGNDSGDGSLRKAIEDANSNPGPHIINFSLSIHDTNSYTTEADVGYWHIDLVSELPTLTTDGTIISGESQAATAHGDSNPYGPEVLINGSALGANQDGLTIAANNCIIKTLVINNFGNSGIYITGNSNEVYGCYLGTNATAEIAAANDKGIEILNGSYNIIGSSESGRRNVISGNDIVGIFLQGANTAYNVIRGNYIGTERTATSALTNTNGGISLQSNPHHNTIGGTTADDKNIISGNGIVGINIDSSNTNEVVGNYIGTDVNGTSAITNEGNGITISGGSLDNNIGDGTAAGRNIISGNNIDGVNITDTNTRDNKVRGNYIGMDVNGTTALSNLQKGVSIVSGASLNVIGGENAGERNIISGNNEDGVVINSSANNLVIGNYIGLDVNGTTDRGNGWKGIRIYGTGSNFNTIEANVISGNDENGIIIGASFGGTEISSSNEVLGNYIGLSSNGSSAIANSSHGIVITNYGQYNKIGNGTITGRNIISGNGLDGIYISGTNVGSNEILGNYIGTSSNGASAVPNSSDGININSCSIINYLGGTGSTEGNVISGNASHGISLNNGDNQQILHNYIGLNANGTNQLTNEGIGLYMNSNSTGNNVGNGNANGRNIISGNATAGIQIDGRWNTIDGNYIGLNAVGDSRLDNVEQGVLLTNTSRNNTINSNFISGNGSHGLQMRDEAASNEVTGNYIGLDATGSFGIQNNGAGIKIQEGGDYNIIGGTTAAERNYISGNNSAGIIIDGELNLSTGNQILGNYIGLDGNGSSAVANNNHGIQLINWIQNTQIGDGTTDGRNYIAGNAGDGIAITGNNTNTNEVNNNVIGWDVAGSERLNGGSAIDYNSGTPLIKNNILNCYIISTGEGGSGAINVVDYTDFSIQNNTIESYVNGILMRGFNNNFNIVGNMISGHNTESGIVAGTLGDFAQNGLIATNEVRSFATGINVAVDSGATLTIDRNTIVKYAENGFYIPSGAVDSIINITNSIFSQDPTEITSTTGTGLKDDGSSANINVSYCNVYGNQTDYTNISSGVGTISAVANFTNATSNDFTLASNSPCINSGTPEGVDMGAYPYSGSVPVVRVITPNGGENWTALTSQNITWYASNEGDPVTNITLSYSTDEGTSYTLITNESNTSSYAWTVANDPTSDALIKIIATTDTGATASDESDAVFTISASVSVDSISLKDTSTGSTSYTNNQTVSVEASGVTGSPTEMIVSSEASFSGASWIPYDANTTETLSAGDGIKTVYYKIRNSNYVESATVSASITVDASAPTAPVPIYPTTGTTTSDATPTLSWNAATAVSGIASYEIRVDGTVVATQGATTSYTSAALSEDSHTWEVRAKNNLDVWGSFSTTQTFTVDASAPPTVEGITLKDTTTGSTSYTNNQTISVEASGVTGSPTLMIISGEASFTGASWQSYSATFEYTTSSGNGTKEVYYKVRNSALTESSTVDASIILDTSSPAVILYQPNGGESLTGGSSYSITWEATDAVSSQAAISINLRYSTDAGASWTSIASAQTNNGSYAWTVPSANSSLCRVSIEAIDQAGNLGFDSSASNFTITSESTAPTIAIKINSVIIKNGDYIPVRPTFVAVITDASSVDTSSIIMTLDGTSVSPTVSIISSTTVEASYATTSDLANESIMTHAITVEASDLISNATTKEISGLKVTTATARIDGNVLTYPTKFNPRVDLTSTISYTLTADTDISIYMVSPAGTIEWTNRIASGNDGAKAGYNEVSFNGISDLSGTYLGNGIYPIKIIAGNRVIGTGYIVIFM